MAFVFLMSRDSGQNVLVAKTSLELWIEQHLLFCSGCGPWRVGRDVAGARVTFIPMPRFPGSDDRDCWPVQGHSHTDDRLVSCDDSF